LVLTSDKVTIEGSTEAGARVLIGGLPANVDPQGTFSQEHKLVEGWNTVQVSSRDEAGNVAVEELRLSYEPEEGPSWMPVVVLLVAILAMATLLLAWRRRGGGTTSPEKDWIEAP
jgi:hypothetical protein